MPYEKLGDLPKEQVDQYSHHQKEAFLAAFNSALEQYGEESPGIRRRPRGGEANAGEGPDPGD